MRGYQFAGTGSYGDVLLGDTCPTTWWPQREATVRGSS